MRKQTVIWTALPNGYAPAADGGTRLRLSVLVSPRLVTTEGGARPTLSQFPDFLHWPSTAVQFTVSLNGGPAIPASIIGPEVTYGDLYGALFKSSTFVRSHVYEGLDDRRIRSFPVRHVMGFLKNLYTDLAKSKPNELPGIEQLGDRESGLGLLISERGRDPKQDYDPDLQLKHQLDELLQKSKAVPPSSAPNPTLDFYQMRMFHKAHTLTRVAPQVPDLDFHQMVSALGDYPALMRQMGLIYDLEFTLPDGTAGSGAVRVMPTWSPSLGATTNVTPSTQYFLDGSRFLAASRPGDPELVNGMLNLGDAGRFGVMQVDVDGAAIKAVDFANGLYRSQVRFRAADTPNRAAAPSMRSAGLSVVKHGRAFSLVQALAAMKQRNVDTESGVPVTLYAEDLVRGYRVDVWDSRSEVWRSLNQRIGTYDFTDAGIQVRLPDEGTVTGGVTRAADGSSPDLYMHESLFRWDGWSLSAPRAGKTISPTESVEHISNAAQPDMPLAVNFKAAPGTLPKLRFGLTYRLRARAVDLAGNSVPLSEGATDFSTATEPAMYARYEPVGSPFLLLREPTTEGEFVERMVIRSNFDTDATGTNERHVSPPKTNQFMAETHGVFDLDGDGRLDKTAYATITGKETNFADDAIHPEEQLALPFLPDPVARGASLIGLPGTAAGDITQISFGSDTVEGAWPGVLPFRIRIAEGSGSPQWDAGARVLTVDLPKAEIAKVRLSSYISKEDLELMGIWQWVKEAGVPAGQMAFLKNLATRGAHWMISPFREILLVHAVQQPLLTPEFKKLTSTRNLGETYTRLTDQMTVSGRSTVKIDLHANWQEPIDPLSEPAWRMVEGNAPVFQQAVSYGDTTLALSGRHDFGDTKYRHIKYTATATTRFAEYFQERVTESVALSGTTPKLLGNAPVVTHSESVTDGGDVTYQRDQDYSINYADGTITRLADGAIPDGTPIDVIYAYQPGPITRDSTVVAEVDVLNSARPAAPKILYVVPTFQWTRESFDDGVAVRRSGGGVRVYMDRPWFSSGDGELLGAVIWPGFSGRVILGGAALNVTAVPESVKPYVTQWGLDPIWLSAATKALPQVEHFPRAVKTGTRISIDELANVKVNVAGHAVGYDERRQLWYSDIEITAGDSYYPFVRLALARYQPMSVDGAHLSRVVLADFAQLAPDRLATITSDPTMPDVLAVTVCGPGYNGSTGGRTSEMEVSVETRRDNIPQDLSWIPVPNSVFPLTVRDTTMEAMSWVGQVNLPGNRGDKPYRLVIKEYERFVTDATAGGGVAFDMAFVAAQNRTERRLVYAAVLEI